MDNKLKFNIGDYVANDYCFGKVIEITDDAYLLDTGQGIPFSCEHNAHIWSITDAKDGDVLADDYGTIIMYHSMCSVGNANVHCCIENGKFIARNIGVFETENFHPATIEQTELMLSKMKESGYEWNAEKKELKPISKPKFNAGEWVIDNLGFVWKIESIEQNLYHICDSEGVESLPDIVWADNHFRLWSITDAKDGDVLIEDSCIFIIQKLGDNSNAAKTYCTLHDDGDFVDGSILYFDIDSTKPATKEQRDILIQKMHEAGYEWDEEKKEIKNVKMESEIIEKFIVGKWYTCVKDFFDKSVHFDKGTAYFCSGEERLEAEDGNHVWIPENSYSNFKLWSISDAKKGDVLVHNDCTFIFMGIKDGIVQAFEENMLEPISFGEPDKDNDYHPATKEQCESLCRKIAEAGYAWDPEKKEIEKIVETPDENKELKPIDKPRFNVGDWVIDNLGFVWKIESIEQSLYHICDSEGVESLPDIDWVNNHFRLWSIQDAKKGDILFQDLMGGFTFIFDGFDSEMAILYSFIISNDGEDVLPYDIGNPNTGIGYVEEAGIIYPATKEQRALIFQKIAEAGYTWNQEKKKIEKIGETPDENTIQPKFKAGDVIVHKLSMKMGSSSWVSGKIEKVEGDRYIFTDGSYFFIKEQDEWAFFEHMPTENTIKPKFKAGDCIVHSTWKDIYPHSSCGTIKEVKDDRYIFEDGSYIKMCDQDLWELSKPKDDDCSNKSSDNGLRYALSILEQSLGIVPGYQANDGLLKHKQAIAAVKNALKQKSSQSD